MLRTTNPSDKVFYVYLHSRLGTGEPFYIGKGNGKRFRKRDGRSRHWKNIVKKDGGFDKCFLIRDVDEELAFLVEEEAIDVYRRRGFDLINATDGGEGAVGRKASAEERAKNSAARKGKPLSAATREAALAFHLGSKQSAEHIEKRVSKLIGKRRTPEHRRAQSINRSGEKRTNEARAKMVRSRMDWLKRNRHPTQDDWLE